MRKLIIGPMMEVMGGLSVKMGKMRRKRITGPRRRMVF